MGDAEITIVMPVIERDAGYFLNFARSYRKNWGIRTDFVFMLRRSEAGKSMVDSPLMKGFAEISNNPLTSMRIVIKEDLIGDRTATMSGPFRAMACKLAISQQVKTPFYLAMDADVLVMRPVENMAALTTRSNVSFRKRDHFYENAAKLLGVPAIAPTERFVSLCPPFFYDTGVAQATWGRITEEELDTLEPWSEKAPWADAFLYETMQSRMMECRYQASLATLTHDPLTHDPVNPADDTQSNIFARCQVLFDQWHPLPNQGPPFTVIHSFTNISPTAIWDRIRDVI